MTTYTEEEVNEKIEKIRRAQQILDNGLVGLQMSIEYLNDQANRGVIPKTVVETMEIIRTQFVSDLTGTQKQAPTTQKEPTQTEE